MPTPVEIVAYDASWPRLYEEAEARLKHLLGPLVLAIDHIGSTAIPDMPAKPIIDIDVTLSSLAEVSEAGRRLVEAGYEARGNRYDDDVWAFLLKSATPRLRVYLCPPANRTHERRLAFRDYLRHHDAAAAAYALLKAQLAERFAYDGDRYTAEKSGFVRQILAMAEETAPGGSRRSGNGS
ncbi:GrpB family protein [Pleomorphomonas oryzae]|uniref:GrpB family protein n=1 Tax=Pleomorphomonas oryzae TaxID=261934 RepID=UPI00041372DC|nr:GrpB family protein [Pleomorphomonas oryzae]